jgi:hypothetical protein
MRRTLTLILGVALFGILAAVVVASQGADDPASTETVTDTVERTTTVEDNPRRERADDDAQNGVDISGPCDEAEHANDPRCGGQPTTTPQVDDHPGADDDRVDNSGPGSENSGPGSVNSGRDDDADDDHGSEDRSGHGGRDDSGGDDDHSGHGGGGDDD